MIKASKKKQKEMEMAQTRSLCKNEEDTKNQLGDSSYATSILEICSKGTSHEDGCSILQINTFFDILPSVAPPHIGGICLLSSTGKVGDFPLETHQALVTEISSRKRELPLKKYSVGPFLQSSKCHPDESLEERSSVQLC